MKKFLSVFIFAGFLFGLSAAQVFAQRQTPGRPAIEASVTFGGITGKPFFPTGGNVAWLSHQSLGHTSIGIDFNVTPSWYDFHRDAEFDDQGIILNPEVNERFNFDTYDVTAGIGYYFRLLAPRSRICILSAGAVLQFGVRCSPFMSQFVKSNGKNYNSVGFLSTLMPELKFEFFPSTNCSLYLSCRGKIRLINGYGASGDFARLYMGFGSVYYF